MIVVPATLVLVFVLLSIETPTVLFMIFFLYLISGPVFAIFRYLRKRQRLQQQD